jgi:CO/xanthine dehydrogenase Mo-binding subunit
MALSEGSRVVDGHQKRLGLVDYKIFTAVDMPELSVHFLQPRRAPSGPLGARSIGEAAVIPAAAAVGNAVASAIGARMRRLPMTPERVWRTARGAS